jgi:hypothetical protein
MKRRGLHPNFVKKNCKKRPLRRLGVYMRIILKCILNWRGSCFLDSFCSGWGPVNVATDERKESKKERKKETTK